MEENEVKKEKTFYKKWWFWVIILLIVAVIGFTIVMTIAFNIVKGEVGDLAIEIQEIYDDATVYSSAGSNNIVIELKNWSNEYTTQLNQIINAVKTRINNGELQNYTKLITLAYIESNNKQDALFVKNEYSIPEFIQNEEETREYIIFEEYENLYDTLNQTMEGYTGLFNSIY